MAEPEWVPDKVVLAFHQLQIAEHGGPDGVREQGLLESALARPRNLYEYSDPQPSLAEIAASYGYGIARNHVFVDGNKRTALVVCVHFLYINNVELDVSNTEIYLIFLKLAAGDLTEKELANWIASNI